MKLNRVLFVIILAFNLFANDEINVNFKEAWVYYNADCKAVVCGGFIPYVVA